jgi:thiol-disulfide isomerase/thioredoxin
MTVNTDMPLREVAPTRWVLCLCAVWCGSCRDYQATFEQLAREHPQDRFVWLDIDDDADLVDDVDVENFPTLLVAEGDTVRFFGPLMPHAETASRLLASLAEERDSRAPGDHLQALIKRVQAR